MMGAKPVRVPIFPLAGAILEGRVKDGETLALGGLLQQREVEQTSKVPILGDLPIFGRLFSNTRRSQEETEVLVFITPHILRDGEAPSEPASLSPAGPDYREN